MTSCLDVCCKCLRRVMQALTSMLHRCGDFWRVFVATNGNLLHNITVFFAWLFHIRKEMLQRCCKWGRLQRWSFRSDRVAARPALPLRCLRYLFIDRGRILPSPKMRSQKKNNIRRWIPTTFRKWVTDILFWALHGDEAHEAGRCSGALHEVSIQFDREPEPGKAQTHWRILRRLLTQHSGTEEKIYTQAH
jgi:hypothetical protein